MLAGWWEIVTANKHKDYVISPFITSLGEDNTEGKEASSIDRFLYRISIFGNFSLGTLPQMQY